MRTRLVLGFVTALLLAAPAHAAPPAGMTVTAEQAVRIADRTDHARGRTVVSFKLLKSGPAWAVAYTGREHVLTEVDVDGRTGQVIQVLNGWHANFRMSRGHFGGLADSWWIWVVLCVLFVAPFFDPRRPLRMLHFDLLALLAFGISHLFFNQGNYVASVPLVYPVLAYLLARMLWLGFRGGRAHGPLVPYARTRWLVAGLVLLVGFRVFVNVDTAKVLDIGEAGVQGAGAIERDRPIYVGDRLHRDTYGPLNYVAYLPFVEASPSSLWSDNPPAAHLASIFFDLLVLLGLFAAGRRLRAGPAGMKLGVALAFAWAAFPYSMYALALNTNDALVAALLVWAFVLSRSPVRSGVLLAAAVAVKFAPLALVPLFARRRPLVFLAAFAAALALFIVPFAPDPGRMWDLTVGFQLHRVTPLSLWTLHPSLGWLKIALAGGALLVALFARERSPALIAAVLIAIQLPSAYWFYFYVVWFAPFVLIALFSLDIPRGTQILSGMRLWSTPSSSRTSSDSPHLPPPRVTIAPLR